jgi:hypothetical protein
MIPVRGYEGHRVALLRLERSGWPTVAARAEPALPALAIRTGGAILGPGRCRVQRDAVGEMGPRSGLPDG